MHFRKAFVSVAHEVLWMIHHHYGILKNDLYVTQNA